MRLDLASPGHTAAKHATLAERAERGDRVEGCARSPDAIRGR